MHSPTETHWQALKRVLRYLKGTIHHCLFLTRGSSMDLKAFSNSDWAVVDLLMHICCILALMLSNGVPPVINLSLDPQLRQNIKL